MGRQHTNAFNQKLNLQGILKDSSQQFTMNLVEAGGNIHILYTTL